MYTKIPASWRTFDGENVTIEELNDLLVELHIPTIVFIVSLMVVGVFGNIIVVYVYTTKYQSSTHRCFILWLAWIDLIACSVGMPLLIVSMLYPYMFPSAEACKTLRFLHVFMVMSSAFIVTAIVIERHRRICFSFSHEMTTKKINLMCLVASVLGCLLAIPAILVFGNSVVETGVNNITGHECFIDPKYEKTSFPKLYFLGQLVISIVSMIILGIFYYRIGRRIYSHHKFIQDHTCPQKPKCSNQDKTQENDYKQNRCVPTVTEGRLTTNSNVTGPVSKSINSKESSLADIKSFDDIIAKEDVSRKVDRLKESKSKTNSNEHSTHELKQTETRTRLQSNKSDECARTGPTLRTKQVTIMLFIITIVFLLSFIPHLVLMVTNSMDGEILKDLSPFGVAMYNLFLRSFVINNMANPIIYGFCDKKFRAECAELAMNIISCGKGDNKEIQSMELRPLK